jgi:hypothetical protein
MREFLLLGALSLRLALTCMAQRQGDGGRGDGKPAAGISAVTQNLKKFEGFYNFYYDVKMGGILLEIDRWGQEFLYFSSLPEGICNGGAERGQGSAVLVNSSRRARRSFCCNRILNTAA